MRALWVILSALMLGCGSAPASIHTPAHATHTAEAPVVDATNPAEVAWSRRASSTDANNAIELWMQQADDDAALLVRVAQARHFFATVHAGDPAQVIAHAEAGLAAAVQALQDMAPELLEQLTLPGHTLDAVTTESSPALYWHARLQLVLAQARGYASLLLIDDQVTRALTACERALPQYDNFGAVVVLAQRDAHPLDLARRDLVSTRRRLDRVIAAEPEFLPHRVALAEHYAVIARDRALFEHELSAVKQAPVSSAAVPEQALAQARATTLLDHVNELFE